jgi:hypothetical protein
MSANDAVDGACSAASKCHRLVASKPEQFKEVRPGNDDGVPKYWRNWRGHDNVMQTRSIRGSGEPVWVIALLKCALTIGTRSAQSIMASGFTAAQTGRTHDRTRPMLQKRQKVLAKAAPSTHDPKRTSPFLQNSLDPDQPLPRWLARSRFSGHLVAFVFANGGGPGTSRFFLTSSFAASAADLA